MGANINFPIGDTRKLTVTHYGFTEGRVSAFRVAGAEDSRNEIPHVTVATFGDAKPRESNEIAEWVPIDNFPITGTIEICQ